MAGIAAFDACSHRGPARADNLLGVQCGVRLHLRSIARNTIGGFAANLVR
jgi:hypothetical protein